MKQEWTSQQTDLTTLGVWPWIVLAGQQAVTVLGLIQNRIEHEAAKVKGAMQAAREVTDAAVKHLFDAINSVNISSPSDDLTTLTNQLFAIEDRIRQYYFTNPSGEEPEPEPTPAPDPEPDPEE